jgi:hypothetical protein
VARLDTHWHANPKVLALGLPAMGLHAWSISYCDAELTDGFIPAGAIPQLAGVKQAVHRLVAQHRWEPVDGGYRLHHYLQYNRSRDVALAKRDRDRARQEDLRRNGVAGDSHATRERIASLPVPVPVPGPGIVPKSDSRTPPNPPRKRRGRLASPSANGVGFDEDGPRYVQQVGADGKREWVKVAAGLNLAPETLKSAGLRAGPEPTPLHPMPSDTPQTP